MMSSYSNGNNQDSYNKNNQNHQHYLQQQQYSDHVQQQLLEQEYLESILPASGLAGVPMWAIWSFVACAVLIVAVLLLDYCVIRRNALGNTCCTRARQKRGTANAAHQKRSTNMLLNKARWHHSMQQMQLLKQIRERIPMKLNRNAAQGMDQEV